MSDTKPDAAPSAVAAAPEAAAAPETAAAAAPTAAPEADAVVVVDAEQPAETTVAVASESDASAQLPPTDKRHVRVQSPPPGLLAGLRESSTPRHGRSLTPLLRHMREHSATRSERASVVRSWRSITPFLKREEQERNTFEIGSNILLQLASYQAIFDKALVMDVSMEEEPPAKYILSEQSVFDKAAIMDISNVEYVYIEDDFVDEEVEETQPEENEQDLDETQEGEEEEGTEEQEEFGQDDAGGAEQAFDEPAETSVHEQPSQPESRAREESPPIDLDEILKPKKPPPKKKKITAAQKEAARQAAAEAEESARLAAEEEARRLAEEAELKRIEDERLAAEAAAAAALAAELARLAALEKAAEEAAKRDPERYRLETERREKEYQTALAISRVPHILVHLLDTTVEEGGNLKLACSVIGTDLKIKWYHDGHEIDPHASRKKYRMEGSGETVSLEILNTTPADSGEYMVRLHNDYGDTGNSAIVRIFDVVKNVPALPSFFKVHGE